MHLALGCVSVVPNAHTAHPPTALELLKAAIAAAGRTDQVVIGMDVAASEFHRDGKYDLDFKSPPDATRLITGEQLGQLYQSFVQHYPGQLDTWVLWGRGGWGVCWMSAFPAQGGPGHLGSLDTWVLWALGTQPPGLQPSSGWEVGSGCLDT